MTDIVERLRFELKAKSHEVEIADAEIKRLRRDLESGMERFYSQGAELDNAKTEIKRLQADNASIQKVAVRFEAETETLRTEIERLHLDLKAKSHFWKDRRTEIERGCE